VLKLVKYCLNYCFRLVSHFSKLHSLHPKCLLLLFLYKITAPPLKSAKLTVGFDEARFISKLRLVIWNFNVVYWHTIFNDFFCTSVALRSNEPHAGFQRDPTYVTHLRTFEIWLKLAEIVLKSVFSAKRVHFSKFKWS